MGEDLRTPFYNGLSREEIIQLAEKEVGYTEYEELTEIDEHEKSKIGPYSIMLPARERFDNLKKYWTQSWNPEESALSNAFKYVCSLMPARSLRPQGFSEAFSLMPKDTSLGLPWLSRDRVYAHLYFERAQACRTVEDIFPAVWFWRGQPKGLTEIPKQRDVWGFDHAETVLGATILYPTLAAMKLRSGFAAWLGDAYVDKEATDLLRIAKGRLVVSLDYSSFDSSLHRSLLDLVDEVLKYWFVDSIHDRITLLGEISATVPIVVPYDVWRGRNGGMPSGSVLTNLRDTIANLLAGAYCAYRNGTVIEKFMVLGDDSVYLFQQELDPAAIAKTMLELGLECNPDKQFVSRRSLHYLQKWHSLDYSVEGVNVGVHSPYRTLSGMCGYERFKQGWSKWMDTARWIMQVENCAWDPRFQQFVRFLISGDVVLRDGTDPTTVFARAGGSDKIRSVLDIASFPFNVKNPDLVDEFKTTRMIRVLQGRG
jgi:hypothetical protein